MSFDNKTKRTKYLCIGALSVVCAAKNIVSLYHEPTWCYLDAICKEKKKNISHNIHLNK